MSGGCLQKALQTRATDHRQTEVPEVPEVDPTENLGDVFAVQQSKTHLSREGGMNLWNLRYLRRELMCIGDEKSSM